MKIILNYLTIEYGLLLSTILISLYLVLSIIKRKQIHLKDIISICLQGFGIASCLRIFFSAIIYGITCNIEIDIMTLAISSIAVIYLCIEDLRKRYLKIFKNVV